MEKEFLNAEPDFDCSWLPEDLEQPDSIASEDLQTAINVFCDEVKEFLCSRCPEHDPQIKAALRHGRSFREIYDMTHDCPKSMKTLAMIITDWIVDVFFYQLLEDVYKSLDVSWMPEDVRRMLQSPEKTDIPRRIEAMRRLREKWKTVPEFAGIGTILKLAGDVDMRDWDEKYLKEAEAA